MSDTIHILPTLLAQAVPATVYVLVNDAMPGFIKIGRTTNDIQDRIKQLDTTGVPLPFRCVYAVKVADGKFVEDRLHSAFSDRRVRQSREFFQMSPERVKSVLELVAGADVTPSGDVVETLADQTALNVARQRRENFRFDLVGIAPGTVLTSYFDDKVTCSVYDSRKVNFEGELTSLSASAVIVARRNGSKASSLAGTEYWLYEGKTLDEIRSAVASGSDESIP